ncbi:carboxypeptidase regulatory-like domain-containing protein [Paenibacillus lycopersici]|uniref:Carboxypeptidase regulatory-like domain-containing protein n=1 Tax=Paenibacillus lycopersici TaxID=2704462 RepID=A0A6C0FYU6_9BACL|nr:carboxypeptidase-like regulatory domain-containing protein [Paenibacillus lycopersici]QHT61837.1 carboxypeptidase regulatory-like domain-containing protein [Paenibacillus lycopersici]
MAQLQSKQWLFKAFALLSIMLLLHLFAPSVSFAAQTKGSIAGQVTDTNGDKIKGAVVKVTVGVLPVLDISNGAGKYSLSNLNPGTYSVTASASGYASKTITGVVVTAGKETTLNIQLSALGVITGKVTDTSGKPVIGALVTDSNGNTVITNLRGIYTLKDLNPGTYPIQASALGHVPSGANNVIVTEGHTTTYDIQLGIDNADPVTKYHFEPIYGTIGSKQYVKGFHVSLQASDGAGGSGVLTLKYRINGSLLWKTYDGEFDIMANTTHKVEYFAVDNAGNTESVNVMDLDKGTFKGAGAY